MCDPGLIGGDLAARVQRQANKVREEIRYLRVLAEQAEAAGELVERETRRLLVKLERGVARRWTVSVWGSVRAAWLRAWRSWWC